MLGMIKTVAQPHTPVKNQAVLSHLRWKRRELTRQMARVEAQIIKLQPGRKPVSVAQLERLLEELSAGLPNLPPLPHDFSRADLYDDHD